MKIENPMFHGIEPAEYQDMLACGGVRQASYPKHAVIFRTGDRTDEFGILLSGKIHIENIDLWGNRIILHSITPGQSFAETYAFCNVPMMVDVTAVERSKVLLIHINLLLSEPNREKPWYVKLLYNLLMLSTGKNLAWSSRVLCISSKHIRTRVMTYLSSEAIRCGSTSVTVPFDRQQMADYLNVDRSALSKELGRMEQDGILTFRKNQFHLLNVEGWGVPSNT